MRRRALLLGLALLAGCVRHPPPPPPAPPHYVLEPSWQADGHWFYPHESFDADQTGLAAVIADPHPKLTTDGEVFDQGAMAAAVQTLQLPAILRVTNLQNGRQVLVRANDRGPDQPARIIALTRRAAELLGIPPEGGTEVRVQVEEAPSRQLSEALQGDAGRLQIDSAPVAAVQAQDLAPPPGIGRTAGRQAPAGPAVAALPDAPAAAAVPLRLPETVLQTTPAPGALMLRASEFSRYVYASRQAAEIGGQVERIRRGRSETYRVVAGPYPTVAAADAALDQALRSGVTDARITVE